MKMQKRVITNIKRNIISQCHFIFGLYLRMMTNEYRTISPQVNALKHTAKTLVDLNNLNNGAIGTVIYDNNPIK